MTICTGSALYLGRVTHTRYSPARHHLSYGVWYMLADLDELMELDRTVRGFSVDRAGLVSFRARDHGPRDGSPLRPWIEAQLAEAGVDLEGGPIRVLCFPRVAGYVFNPISVWFCHHRDGSVRAIAYEVSNTYGERHTYVVPIREGAHAGETVRRAFDKELFVSPFIEMDARYEFATRVPDDRASVLVRETVPEGTLLVAAFTGKRVPLTTTGLMRALIGHPFVTIKVIAGIHWEAVKLWRKGVPHLRHRTSPPHQATVLPSDRARAGGRSRT